MRCIGVRRGGTNLFCGLMNMPPPAVRYIDDNNNILLKIPAKKFVMTMRNAVQESAL